MAAKCVQDRNRAAIVDKNRLNLSGKEPFCLGLIWLRRNSWAASLLSITAAVALNRVVVIEQTVKSCV